MYKCPKCGCKEFRICVTQHEEWIVDEDLEYITRKNSFGVDYDDTMMCCDCGHDGTLDEFEVREDYNG